MTLFSFELYLFFYKMKTGGNKISVAHPFVKILNPTKDQKTKTLIQGAKLKTQNSNATLPDKQQATRIAAAGMGQVRPAGEVRVAIVGLEVERRRRRVPLISRAVINRSIVVPG